MSDLATTDPTMKEPPMSDRVPSGTPPTPRYVAARLLYVNGCKASDHWARLLDEAGLLRSPDPGAEASPSGQEDPNWVEIKRAFLQRILALPPSADEDEYDREHRARLARQLDTIEELRGAGRLRSPDPVRPPAQNLLDFTIGTGLLHTHGLDVTDERVYRDAIVNIRDGILRLLRNAPSPEPCTTVIHRIARDFSAHCQHWFHTEAACCDCGDDTDGTNQVCPGVGSTSTESPILAPVAVAEASSGLREPMSVLDEFHDDVAMADEIVRLRLALAYTEDIARCRGEENETLRSMHAELMRRLSAGLSNTQSTAEAKGSIDDD